MSPIGPGEAKTPVLGLIEHEIYVRVVGKPPRLDICLPKREGVNLSQKKLAKIYTASLIDCFTVVLKTSF